MNILSYFCRLFPFVHEIWAKNIRHRRKVVIFPGYSARFTLLDIHGIFGHVREVHIWIWGEREGEKYSTVYIRLSTFTQTRANLCIGTKNAWERTSWTRNAGLWYAIQLRRKVKFFFQAKNSRKIPDEALQQLQRRITLANCNKQERRRASMTLLRWICFMIQNGLISGL